MHTHMFRHMFRTATFASALAATLATGAAGQASELRVGFSADALTLDPANHRNRETETIIRNMYDGVLTRDAKMAIVPELAESFRQVDTTTYDFTIRQGVTFHDGSPMTAEDIKFTFDRLILDNAMGGQTSPRKGLLGPLKEVTIVDPRTVRFILSAPWPILPAMLPFQEVVSKAFVEKEGSAALATKVNGTGPFRLVDWRKGDSIVMERFDGYYGGATDIPPVGKACVDRVIFKVIPESASRVAALLSGDVDIINELPAHAMNQVARNANTAVVTVGGTRTNFVALNNTKPPFDNVLVRKAANHALDKKLIIDKILNGTATPLNGELSPDAFAFKADLPEYAYDVAKAKALLAEAGYPNGIDVTLDVEGPFKDTAEAIASLLAKAGIRARVEVGEASLLTKKWRQDKDKVGDMTLTSWGNGSLDPSDIAEPTLQTGGRGNSAGYANPKVDELLVKASTEIDKAKRAAMYHEAQAIVNDEAPWIFLWLPQDIYGVSKRLSGWQPSADSRINLHDACVK